LIKDQSVQCNLTNLVHIGSATTEVWSELGADRASVGGAVSGIQVHNCGDSHHALGAEGQPSRDQSGRGREDRHVPRERERAHFQGDAESVAPHPQAPHHWRGRVRRGVQAASHQPPDLSSEETQNMPGIRTQLRERARHPRHRQAPQPRQAQRLLLCPQPQAPHLRVPPRRQPRPAPAW
jgi:hypothetical protein